MAPENIPKFMVEAYTDIMFLMLDVGDFIRPGCTLLDHSFAQVFFTTLIVHLLCLLFFGFLVIVTAYLYLKSLA